MFVSFALGLRAQTKSQKLSRGEAETEGGEWHKAGAGSRVYQGGTEEQVEEVAFSTARAAAGNVGWTGRVA